MLLAELDLDALYNILDCEKLKELIGIFGEERIRQFLAESSNHPVLQYHFSRTMQSFALFINDAPSYPLIILWSILGLINLGLIALTVITVSVVLFTVGLSVFYFIANYLEMQKAEYKFEKFLQFIDLKNRVIDLIFEREGIQLELEEKPSFKDKKKLTRIRDSVGLTLFTASTLFGTFFLGINAIVASFGATILLSALTGPLGLMITLSICCGAGICFGINYYQMSKREDEKQFEQKYLTTLFNKKNSLCQHYREKKKLMDLTGDEQESNESYQAAKKIKRKENDSAKTNYSLPFFEKRMIVAGPTFLTNPNSLKLEI
ncbi:hypothetical protein [Legionella cardiaca]|uniref:Uncharacterized protein n=1 Tax=Legionella cardiaca TaxID=1071983 RepID=A0ABY8AT53_9GAMM|nr:hypothetical protein [Legionella cardiaca]WED43848.1 hypothetical protein PXX05_03445 [Legionella cardiaca]